MVEIWGGYASGSGGAAVGGDVIIWGGGGGGPMSAGGDAMLIGGAGETNAGRAMLTGGTCSDFGDGGNAEVLGGPGFGSSNEDGGDATVTGGAGIGIGTGGVATLTAGASGVGATGTGGAVTIISGASLATNGTAGATSLSTAAGAGTGAGGLLTVQAGASGSGATGDGGAIELISGDSNATDGAGGRLDLFSGEGAGTGTGGVINITAGDGGATGDGGDISIITGDAIAGHTGELSLRSAGAPPTFDSGDVRIGSGFASGGGTAGSIRYIIGNGEFFTMDLNGSIGTFHGVGTNAPAIVNQNTSAINVTLLPGRSDTTTGIGGLLGTVGIFSGNTELANFDDDVGITLTALNGAGDDGGLVTITSGDGVGTGAGGAVTLTAGASAGTGTVGGVVTIAGGAGDADDGGDPFFDSVVLLLDWAGNDGDTSTTDLSNSSHSLSFIGNSEIDTGITFIGENTLLLDGAGDRVQIPDNADWDFGTDDFTIEIGVYYDDNAELITFISHFDTPNGWWIRRTAGAELHFGVGVTEIYQEAWTGAINTFFNIAVSRQGTDLRVFVDGVQLGATVTDSTDFTGSAVTVYIGSLNGVAQLVTGNIGATRITKGVARYTTDFTPPAAFYPTFLGGGGIGGDVNIIGGIGGNTLGSINIQPISTAPGETTELRFLELVASGTNYIGFKAPDSIASNTVWALPSTDSTGTQALVSDGSGNLDWAGIGGGGDVSATGGPLNNEIAVWTNGTTIEGDSNFTWDSATSTLNLDGSPVTITGAASYFFEGNVGLDGDSTTLLRFSSLFGGIQDHGFSMGADGIVFSHNIAGTSFELSGDFTQFVINKAGTAALPALAFGDDDTGFYEPADDTLALSLGAVEISRFQAGTVTTTDATVTEIIAIAVASGEGFGFEIHVMGTQDSTGHTVFERVFGAIRNQGGTTDLVGSTITDRTDDAEATTWIISVEADDAGDELTVDVTGEAAHTIDWKVRVEILQV